MRNVRLFLHSLATYWLLPCIVVCGQNPSEVDSLRLDVVLDDTLRSQPGVEVLGNFGGSLEVTAEGLIIEQPPRSEKIEGAGLRLSVEPTKDFSLQIQLDVLSSPKIGSNVSGLFITLGSDDAPKTAIGLLRGPQDTALATAPNFEKMTKKSVNIRSLDGTVRAISIVKTAEKITVSAGPNTMAMEKVASLETALDVVDVVDVIATAGTSSRPTGRYLLKYLSFVGDRYFKQPPPPDYSYVWSLVKWLGIVGALGIFVAVGIKYDLFRKKIF